MHENEDQIDIKTVSGLARSETVAVALRGAARRLRFSTSNRSALYKAVGLRPRPLTQWFKIIYIALTISILVAPNLAVITYFGLIASDQFQSETRFTVRTSIPAIGKDQFAKVTGIPSTKIVQDTQIVTNFLVSQRMLELLEKQINLAQYYNGREIDVFSRLGVDLPQERILDYWKRMVSSSISVPSGIVTIKLRAFRADDSQGILMVVLKQLEQVINEMNDRIWRDVTKVAESNMKNASTQLRRARERFQAAQNATGVFTVESSANSLTDLITKLETERIAIQQKYDVNGRSLGNRSPQMRLLRREIESKDRQIDALKAQLTGAASEQAPLSETASSFSQLRLEQQLAEQQFAASVRTLEQVQFSSQQQLMYLDAFVAPTLPQEARYPQRLLWIGVTFGVSLLLWAAVVGSLSALHTRLS